MAPRGPKREDDMVKDYEQLYQGATPEDKLYRERIAEGWSVTANEHPDEGAIIEVEYVDGTRLVVKHQQLYLYREGRVQGTLAVVRFWRLADPTQYSSDPVQSAASALGRKGGQSKSAAKTEANRAKGIYGKLGGRPRKTKPEA